MQAGLGIEEPQCTSNCSSLEAEEVEGRWEPLLGVQWGEGKAWEAGGNSGWGEGWESRHPASHAPRRPSRGQWGMPKPLAHSDICDFNESAANTAVPPPLPSLSILGAQGWEKPRIRTLEQAPPPWVLTNKSHP